jgi:methylation protein EvaC
MIKCRICESDVEPFMSFGKMPIANGFLAKEQFSDEYFFELEPVFCERCHTFQIGQQPDPEKLFHANYAFFSRTSKRMVEHFKSYAKWVVDNFIKSNDSFVVEIGSNDGILLENFARVGMRHLGVEPSANVAEEGRKHGVNTMNAFFNAGTAGKVIADEGQADVIVAANAICHIPDLKGLAEGIKKLLKPDGVFIFEDPYLGDMIEKTSYDQIYDEHVFIFSVHAVMNIFDRYDLELIDIKPQVTHGGSMRYVLGQKGEHSVFSSVKSQLDHEKELGLHLGSSYQLFKNNCEKSREELVQLLESEKKKGRRVVGYGATSKSTTVLNYCGIGPEHLDFISDTTPGKQNKFSPGMHIPVKPYDVFKNNYPDSALLFAWNHKEEIMQKETSFKESGGVWMSYVPKVGIN